MVPFGTSQPGWLTLHIQKRLKLMSYVNYCQIQTDYKVIQINQLGTMAKFPSQLNFAKQLFKLSPAKEKQDDCTITLLEQNNFSPAFHCAIFVHFQELHV